jgi:regulator of protease activity HflC (stomatin/prohibitin superfamily)
VVFILFFLIIVAAVIGATVSVVAEYERAVVFRLGRVVGARGPGVVFVIRGIDEVKRVSMRLTALHLPVQDLITRDNVAVRVRAVVYAKVTDPVKVVVEVEDYRAALGQVAQASLRAVVGQVSLDQLLHDEAAVINPLKQLVDQRTSEWGVEIGLVEIKDVELPESMRQSMVMRRPVGAEDPTSD